MTQTITKSASLTLLDTVPVLYPDAGQGAFGGVRQINDFQAVTTAQLGATTTQLNMVRVSSTAVIKSLALDLSAVLDSNGSPTLTWDVGLFYSDAPNSGANDGTNLSLAGTVISENLFAAAFASPTSVGRTSIIGLGTYTVDKFNTPLWEAAGLSSDPGGYFDIVVTVHAAAATAVAGKIGVNCEIAF